MFTLLTTWVTQRIITVTAVSVLTVAAVPTTLVIVSHDDHQTIAVIQPADDHSKTILIAAVKKAGDDVITQLNASEATCDTTLTQTVNASKVAAKVQPVLASSKTTVHKSVAPVVAAIKADEERFAHLKFITPQDEENELSELNLIKVIALGDGKTSGTITIICETVKITITETINITVIQQTPAPCHRDDDD
jgi:hypothetical protein